MNNQVPHKTYAFINKILTKNHLNLNHEKGWFKITDIVKAAAENNIIIGDIRKLNCGLNNWFNKKFTVINQYGIEKRDFSVSKIRANFGHEVDFDILEKSEHLPKYLFTAVGKEAFEKIHKEGLIPQKKVYLFLRGNIKETIKYIDNNLDFRTNLLIIDAEKAAVDGSIFTNTTNDIWLSNRIAPIHLSNIGYQCDGDIVRIWKLNPAEFIEVSFEV